jgi:tryptophan synthase alpha chain
MSAIADAFAAARAERRIAVIPYLTVDYPNLDATRDLALALVAGGADIVELGIPFSDPLADGATIQRSSFVALRNGTNLNRCIETADAIRQETSAPLVFMGYYNSILCFGTDRFCGRCRDAGVDGLIVPDLPPEEASELKTACQRSQIDLIFLVAPTSTDERLALIAGEASGFVYCVALAGTTGARASLAAGLREFVGRVRTHTDLPLAVGFGISRPEHVAELAEYSDGAIIGSALMDLIDRLPAGERMTGVRDYIRSLREAGAAGVSARGSSRGLLPARDQRLDGHLAHQHSAGEDEHS